MQKRKFGSGGDDREQEPGDCGFSRFYQEQMRLSDEKLNAIQTSTNELSNTNQAALNDIKEAAKKISKENNDILEKLKPLANKFSLFGKAFRFFYRAFIIVVVVLLTFLVLAFTELYRAGTFHKAVDEFGRYLPGSPTVQESITESGKESRHDAVLEELLLLRQYVGIATASPVPEGRDDIAVAIRNKCDEYEEEYRPKECRG